MITQEQISSLPIAGRSAITLALPLPGTGSDTTRESRPGANVGSGGITTAATNYIVDGLNNMISMAGDAREDVPQSAIQEFRVDTAQMPAEFGGRSGGVVNVVTKSGTNRFAGEAFEFFRHKSLNAMNLYQVQRQEQFGDREPDFRRDQWGLTAGGPIVQNRAHFFGAIDRTKEQRYFQVNTGKPAYAWLAGRQLSGRQLREHWRSGNSTCCSVPASASRSGRRARTRRYLPRLRRYQRGLHRHRQRSARLHVPREPLGAALQPRLQRVRGALRRVEPAQPAEPLHTPGSIRISAPRATRSRASAGARDPGRRFQNPYTSSATRSPSAPAIICGSSAAARRSCRPTSTTPGSELGNWTFGQDQHFNPADPAFNVAQLTGATQFTASFPTFTIHLLSQTYEAYVQDQWRLGSKVTVNLGLRYDRQTKIFNEDFTQDRYPRPLPFVDFGARGDANNIAPRAAVAWDVTGDARTLVRAGYGLVYGNLQNAVARGEHDAFRQFAVNIRNPSYPDP